MNSKKIISLIFLISIPLLLIFFLNKEKSGVNEPLEKSMFMLNTVISIKTYENTPNSSDAIDKAFKGIEEIENTLSPYIADSEITLINDNAGIKPIIVSDSTFDIIKKSITYSNLSDGFFDISIGPLVKLWNITSEHPIVPDKKDIDSLLELISFNNIILDESNKSVFLKNPNMALDLGGIAKGYAADKAKSILLSNGINNALLNLGGNVSVLGTKPDGEEFKLGIQDPFLNRGEYFAIVPLRDKSLVTSGIYERYFEQDNKRYHHILNPFDGYPMDNDIVSVSIISVDSIDGDALSTSVFCLGKERGLDLIESLDNIETIIVDKDKYVYISSGLKDMLEITDSQFKFKTLK